MHHVSNIILVISDEIPSEIITAEIYYLPGKAQYSVMRKL